MSRSVLANLVTRMELQSAQFQREMARVHARTEGLNRASQQTAAGMGRLNASLASVGQGVKGLASLATAAAALNKLVTVAREFDRMNASLVTMTGSSDNAAKAFIQLERIAAETPYDLAQVVDGFSKLVALGLDPSEKAIKSYGNTASAMGKDLNQMVEAVADAATGEFERLKEFGIKAKSEGDRVTFTFRGVKTEVGKNAAEIERYLQGIGEKDFAGAMAERMKTLDGSLSVLADSWDALFRSISNAGTGQLIQSTAMLATEALDELSAAISSGQLPGYLSAWGSQWSLTFGDIAAGSRATGDFIVGGWDGVFSLIEARGRSSAEILSDAFWQFPANIRAVTQIAAVEIGVMADKAAAYAAEISDSLNPFGDGGDYDGMTARLEAINQARLDSIDAILAERDATEKAASARMADADAARKAYELERSKSFDLGQFRVSPSAGGDGASEASAAEAKKYEARLAAARGYMTELSRLDDNEAERIAAWRADELQKLQEFLADKAITQRQYQDGVAAIEVEASSRRTELAKKEREEWRKLANERTEDVRRQVEDQYAATQDSWDRYVQSMRETAENTDQLWVDTLSRFSSNVAQSVTDAIYNFESLGDLGGSIVEALGRQMVQTLVEMGMQRLVLWGIERTIQASTRSGYVATIAGQAQAASILAGINAYASTAAIPIVGPVAAPGAAAAALAYTAPAAGAAAAAAASTLAGVAHGGLDYVPKESTYLLDKGERVLSPRQNRDLDAFMGEGGSKINITINDGGRNYEVQQLTARDVEIIVADKVPKLMAAETANPGSRFNRALTGTRAAPRRL